MACTRITGKKANEKMRAHTSNRTLEEKKQTKKKTKVAVSPG